MTRPTQHQIDEIEVDYPTTWPAVVGFSLWRFGIIGILLAMIVVLFYYLQKSNERAEGLAKQMMNCIVESTATQRTTAQTLSNVNDSLMKHQAWEEKILDVTLPKLDRIETAVHQK